MKHKNFCDSCVERWLACAAPRPLSASTSQSTSKLLCILCTVEQTQGDPGFLAPKHALHIALIRAFSRVAMCGCTDESGHSPVVAGCQLRNGVALERLAEGSCQVVSNRRGQTCRTFCLGIVEQGAHPATGLQAPPSIWTVRRSKHSLLHGFSSLAMVWKVAPPLMASPSIPGQPATQLRILETALQHTKLLTTAVISRLTWQAAVQPMLAQSLADGARDLDPAKSSR